MRFSGVTVTGPLVEQWPTAAMQAILPRPNMKPAELVDARCHVGHQSQEFGTTNTSRRVWNRVSAFPQERLVIVHRFSDDGLS